MFTSLFDANIAGDFIDSARVRTSPLQALPGASNYFRFLAPLYPLAFENFDLSAYDTIVSTTTAWAKGVRFRPGAVHVCYIHTVSRFAFAYDQYVGGFGLGTFARPLVKRLVAWDREAAMRPTAFIANSRNVARRVRHYYGRDAHVVHCPVDLERFVAGTGSGDYMLVVSRLLAYKRIDLAIEACKLAGKRLVVVGAGPAERALKALAVGTRTEFLGAVPDAALPRILSNARAVILPGEEDYGLVPLEANASGRPVIAYGRGGALETIVSGMTGEYFSQASPASLAAVLGSFDCDRYDPAKLRAHAEAFGPAPFKLRFAALVDDIVNLRSGAPRELAQQR